MDEPIISVSGLRGVVGRSLTPEIAMRYACALAVELPEGPIVVSRDSRVSGPMLAAAVQSALMSVGRGVIDAGVAATPTTGVLVRQYKAAGGVQVSASHNPPEYNGLKLFSGAGRVIPAEAGEQVLKRYRLSECRWVDYTRLGEAEVCADPLSEHLRLVLATVDVDRIRGKRFSVLLDSNHGAGGLLGRRLLESLGCEVNILGEEPSGRFAHPPEPTEENLQGVGEQVTAAGAAVGFCQDPDADRLALIDEVGRYIGEEYTLAVCLNHVLTQRKGPVVANCATSRMAEDIAAGRGVAFHRSAVGEANVVDLMLEQEAVFGGEGNGGPIDPQVGYVRDSFVGMALVLDALAARGAKLSELAAEPPRYEIVKTRSRLDRSRLAAARDALRKHFADAAYDPQDGLRLDWPDRWLLIRASNTEPIVRIIAEAPTREEAERLCEEAAGVIHR